MTTSSKMKGYRAEAEVVKLFTASNIQAKRQPLSGAHKDFKGDVVLPNGDRIEVKNRESIANYIWEWLAQGGAKYLVLRKNHRVPLAVMPLTELGELLRIKQEYEQTRAGCI